MRRHEKVFQHGFSENMLPNDALQCNNRYKKYYEDEPIARAYAHAQ
jgi:hypothetical protein